MTSSVSSINSIMFGNYSTPQRKYYPPSDIESDIDLDADQSNSSSTTQSQPNQEVKKLNKLLDIYKNKFNQLKDAYNEVENEKEKIKVNKIIQILDYNCFLINNYNWKKVLAESQDNVLKRVQELKSQIEVDRLQRRELESQHIIKLAEKDRQIAALKSQVIIFFLCFLNKTN